MKCMAHLRILSKGLPEHLQGDSDERLLVFDNEGVFGSNDMIRVTLASH